MEQEYKNVRNYIKENWKKAIKLKDCIKDFPLPFDYIAPCVDVDLTNLYY